MDSGLSFNATHEIRDAIDVLKWIQANIECALSVGGPEIKPDLSKLALVGHSRGGKVVFSMGIQLNGTIPISAIIGLDPVDGDRQGIQTNPPVLTFKENNVNLTVPTLIVGTRRGSKNWPLFPPCAPEDVNHNEFYKDLIEPVYHFVVGKEYGHMDFLDDAVCKLRSFECMGTVGSRARMSRFAGVILVAFVVKNSIHFSSYFLHKATSTSMASLRPDGAYLTEKLCRSHGY
jgi:chlorophyllase